MAEKARAGRAKDLRRPVGPADAPLQERGRQLVPREAGNIVLPANPGLSVKDSYWRWPECKPRYTISGTIDGPNPFTLLTNLNCDGVGYIKPFQIVSSVTNAIANVWTYGALKVYPETGPLQRRCKAPAATLFILSLRLPQCADRFQASPPHRRTASARLDMTPVPLW